MIQVYFRKSPTGHPFYLAYSQGEHGFVHDPQKVLALEKAGIIDPVSDKVKQLAPAGDFLTSEELEPEPPAKELDSSTEEGVKAIFGVDVKSMQAYCDEHGIKYGKSAKRPEYFWAKIAKYHSK